MLFTQWVFDHWNQVIALSLSEPKKCLNNAVRYMVGFLGSFPKGQELGSMIVIYQHIL